MHKYYTLLFSLLPLTYLAAQCSLTVDAGPDMSVCGLNNTGTLSGNVFGNSTSFQWTPAAGLSNPNSLNPTVSAPGVYTLTATGPSNINLIANGDFEAGAGGFSSDYTFNPIPILNGTYTTVVSPQLVVSTFPPCDDHTFGDGTGQMLLVNGDGTPGENVWCQTVPVDPNTNYDLSAWVSTLVPISLAQLQFSVNGQLVGGSVSPTATPCEWVPFSATWNSGASTSATVCIVTQSSSGFGNDFVLDDIEMYGECQVMDQVQVEFLPEPVSNVQAFRCLGDCFLIGNTPYCGSGDYSQTIPAANGCDSTVNLQLTVLEAIAVIVPPDTLSCYNDFTVELNASPSSVSPFTTYSWSGPNGFSSTLQNPIISNPGTYTLEVTSSAGGTVCSNSASVNVVEQSNQPAADAGSDAELGCGVEEVLLDGSASDTGTHVVYTWTGPGGFSSGSLTPTVSDTGTYILEARDTLSGCSTQDSVVVQGGSNALSLSLQTDTLSCSAPTAALTAIPDSNAVIFVWSGPNGFTDSLLNTSVTAPGWYAFRQTDSTGCSLTDSIFVEADTLLPTFDLSTAALSCNQPTDSLRVVGLPEYDALLWSGPNGFSGTSESVAVSEAGVYQLQVVGTNGCSAQDSVLVAGDFSEPAISTTGAVLDCGDDAVNIAASTADTVLEWSWSGPNSFSVNADTVSVSAIGAYSVSATGLNGCTATDTVLVQAGQGLPQLSAMGSTLTCSNPETNLSGNATNGASLSWSGPNGFSSTANNPLVTLGGDYTLTATLSNNCAVDTTVSVMLDTLPPDISAAADTIDCLQTTVNLQASSTSIVSDWSWSGPAGFSSNGAVASTSIAGPYQVRAIGANGCADSITLEVVADTLAPAVQLTADTLSCLQPTVSLMADVPAAEEVAWSGPNSFSSLSQNASTTQSGTYLLEATAANGCTTLDSIKVVGDTEQPELVVTADTLTCSQTAVTLSAASTLPVAYTWTGADGFLVNQPDPVATEPGDYSVQAEAANGCADTAVVTVAIDTLPPALQLSADTLTCDNTVSTLSATAPGAATFSWAGPGNFSANTSSTSTAAAGWYTLTATAENGCTAQDSVQVVVDQTPPTLMLADDTISCATPAVSLQAESPDAISYSWSGPDSYSSGIAQPTVERSGTYILTVTSSNGCSRSDTLVIAADTLAPSLELSADTLSCNQQQAQLAAVSNSPDLAYSWTGPASFTSTLAEPLVNAPGLYALTVTAPNGCRQMEAVDVITDTMPPSLQATAGAITCSNPVAQLAGSAGGVGGAPLWSGPDGFAQPLQSVGVTQAGTYTFTFIATNGCADSLQLAVLADTIAPQLSAGDLALDCRQPAAPLPASVSGSTGLELNWSGPNGFAASVLQPTVEAAGSYQLLALNPANGCVDSVSSNVSLDTLPPAVSALSADVLDCLVDTVALTGTGSAAGIPLAFSWSTSDGLFGESPLQANTTATAPGLYILTVENLDNGCTAADSVVVQEITAEPEAIDLAVSPPFCEGSTGSARIVAVQGGIPPYLFSLEGQPFLSINTFSQLQPGTYQLQVEDANGCRATQAFTVPQPLPLAVDLPAEVELHFSETYQLEPLLNFPESIVATATWSPADFLSCSDCLRPVWQQPAEGGTYTLAIVTTQGCEVSAQLQLRVLKDRRVYLPNAFSPGNDDGRNDFFTVYAALDEVVRVRRLSIFDRWGGQVFDRRDFLPNQATEGWDGRYRGEAAPAGLYVYWAEVEFADGQSALSKGEVLLLR